MIDLALNMLLLAVGIVFGVTNHRAITRWCFGPDPDEPTRKEPPRPMRPDVRYFGCSRSFDHEGWSVPLNEHLTREAAIEAAPDELGLAPGDSFQVAHLTEEDQAAAFLELWNTDWALDNMRDAADHVLEGGALDSISSLIDNDLAVHRLDVRLRAAVEEWLLAELPPDPIYWPDDVSDHTVPPDNVVPITQGAVT